MHPVRAVMKKSLKGKAFDRGKPLVKLYQNAARFESEGAAALGSKPEDAAYGPSLLRLGEALASAHRWAKSEDAFAAYLGKFADGEQWFQARFGIGWARENQSRYPEAISSYNEVVAGHRGPTAARAQFQIGECLFAQKKYDEAVAELLKVDILYAYPEWSAGALYEAGRCFAEMAKIGEARQQFRAVVQQHQGTHWAKLAAERLDELSKRTKPGA